MDCRAIHMARKLNRATIQMDCAMIHMEGFAVS